MCLANPSVASVPYINIVREMEFNKVLSIGWMIPPGEYCEIHSIHKRVVNFKAQGGILSICARDIAPGPLRIILDAELVDDVYTFRFCENELRVNDATIEVAQECVFRNVDFQAASDMELIKEQLQRSRNIYEREASTDSIYGILKKTSIKGFERGLADSFRRGMDKLRVGDYIAGVNCFKRKGIGLTPSGDDFLCGFMLAMAWLNRTQKKRLSEIHYAILCESLSDNVLMNTFLQQAHALLLNQDWEEFLRNLTIAGTDLNGSVRQLLSHGASSGADELCGFFFACEVFGDSRDYDMIERIK